MGCHFVKRGLAEYDGLILIRDLRDYMLPEASEIVQYISGKLLSYQLKIQPGFGSSNKKDEKTKVCYDYYVVYFDSFGFEMYRVWLFSDCPIVGVNDGPSDDPNDDSGGGTFDEEQELRNIIVTDPSLDQIPCAKEVLQDYLSLNADMRNLIESIFNGEQTNVDLTIKAGYTGTNFAITQSQVVGSSNSNFYGFKSTITLSNNNSHSGCSKDLILFTILHETIHSYYDYLYKRDGYIVVGTYPIFSREHEFQHFGMAQDYVDLIASTLIDYNPDLDPVVAQHLAWASLEETEAYENGLTQEFKNAMNETMEAAKCMQTEEVIDSYEFKRCE